MRYFFFPCCAYPYPLAAHVQRAGHEVVVAPVRDLKDLKLPDQEKEEPKLKEQRLSAYEGMIKKTPLVKVMDDLSRMSKAQREECFFFFDFNDTYKLSEQVLKMGFRKGLFPTEFYYKMEKERGLAKRFVKKHYDGIKVAESKEFKSAQDGEQFIKESEDMWVLKSNGNYGRTVVPHTDDVDIARELLLDALSHGRKDYETNGFTLEKKILKPLEITPVMVFWDGKPVYSLVEFENKEFGAGNTGIQKGGNQGLSVWTELDCPINKIAFPEVVYALARKQPGLSIFDAGLLFDGKDFWFTEMCAMRYGWCGILSEIVMRDDGSGPFVANYFEDIARRESPILNKYGAYTRLFNYDGDMEQTNRSPEGIPIFYDEEIEDNLFLYHVKKQGKRLVSVGEYDFIGTVTGASDTFEGAVSKAYDCVDKLFFEKIYFRNQEDFLSTGYRTSIPNRLTALEPYIFD